MREMDGNQLCSTLPQDWGEKLPHGNFLQGLPLLAPQGATGLSNKTWVRPWSRLATGSLEVT